MNDQAPWLPLFLQHVEEGEGWPLDFCLATSDRDTPRARFLLQHGFLSLPKNASGHDKPEGDSKVTAVSTSCPTFATASSSRKARQITASAASTREQTNGGLNEGGGPVEGAWWMKLRQVQWRILGKCWFISNEEHSNQPSSKDSAAWKAISRHLHDSGSLVEERGEDFSWDTVLRDHYDRLPDHMRRVVKLEATSVGIIVPVEVELMDMSDSSSVKKWVWKDVQESPRADWQVVRRPARD